MDPITIRFSTDADRKRILELAELHGRAAPQGDVLLAEADGRRVAASGWPTARLWPIPSSSPARCWTC
jgi:hypothetical protein